MRLAVSLLLTISLTAFGIVLVSLIIGVWPAWIDVTLAVVGVVGGTLGVLGVVRDHRKEGQQRHA